MESAKESVVGTVSEAVSVCSSASETDLAPDSLADSIDELLADREAARRDGEYARADAIRDTLEALGIEVMDRPEGPEWRRKVELG